LNPYPLKQHACCMAVKPLSTLRPTVTAFRHYRSNGYFAIRSCAAYLTRLRYFETHALRLSFRDLLGGLTRQTSALRADVQPPCGAGLSHFSRGTEAGLRERS